MEGGRERRREEEERKCEHLIFRCLKHVGVAGCG